MWTERVLNSKIGEVAFFVDHLDAFHIPASRKYIPTRKPGELGMCPKFRLWFYFPLVPLWNDNKKLWRGKIRVNLTATDTFKNNQDKCERRNLNFRLTFSNDNPNNETKITCQFGQNPKEIGTYMLFLDLLFFPSSWKSYYGAHMRNLKETKNVSSRILYQ